MWVILNSNTCFWFQLETISNKFCVRSVSQFQWNTFTCIIYAAFMLSFGRLFGWSILVIYWWFGFLKFLVELILWEFAVWTIHLFQWNRSVLLHLTLRIQNPKFFGSAVFSLGYRKVIMATKSGFHCQSYLQKAHSKISWKPNSTK